jgi:7-cyano-7-deazaguanine reductase
MTTMKKTKKSAYEGLQRQIRGLRLPAIETWGNQYPDKKYAITIETNEVTCICPKTGLPDFGSLRICYIPRARCVELKSFKLYLTAFRNIGIFHEHITNRILDDFTRACAPRWVHISVQFNPRGGITTTVEREYGRKN